ncbi:DUF2254 domain-containing protein [Allopontixanthobacter sp.]|uniref:DUF2254 domain-containing protein n=1 Tax=Allopontixanthobacter sp. TaxID=2906452 RepID=UPI002AB9AD2E|nr:DUF2254 domain-containing protein [Allopontixanthobacter sp.]MDZ4306866.1 DUF2254 domain-containing protein [Allopontixanthobacter sp.]
MTEYPRWLWAKLNSNYWFYPALFSLIAAGLALGMVWLDRHGFAEFLNEIAWIIPARPQGASNMLTVIAGSMIGVASTVFSITIAAVAYASGAYGPRLLTNFMEDKGNQFSLATFIGTFVYALMVLRAVRSEDEVAPTAADAAATTLPGFVPQLSLLVGLGLMAVSIGVLVFFLNHIPASIRINTVLEGIGKRLLDGIEDSYPEPDTGRTTTRPPQGRSILAERTGYVQLISFSALARIAKKFDGRISLAVRTGDFVHPGMAIADLCDAGLSGDKLDQELIDDLLDCFTLGATRTPEQDLQFLIDELVEIGLRALSPGINDPFTAITALHWLGAATALLGTRDLHKHVGNSDKGLADLVLPLPDDFTHYVTRGFGNFRSAAATSTPAALVMLDTLRNCAAPIRDETRQAILHREGERLIQQAREHLTGPDLQDVEARFAGFTRAMAG